MRKNAFTLTETLLMVAVIGIIAVISAVSLKNMAPDKDVVMIRKAYTDISKAVAVLVNNQNLYPYAHVAMNGNGSKLSPLWQYVAGVVCDQFATAESLQESSFDESINGNLEYYEEASCGGGGGGGGSSSTTSSLSTGGFETLTTNYCSPLITGLCEVGQSSYAYCNANCTYTCVSGANSYTDSYGNLICSAPCSSGAVWSSTTNSCETIGDGGGGEHTTSVSLSSKIDLNPIEPEPFDPGSGNNAPDINKGSGSLSSGTNLKDGTYADQPYEVESTGGAVELNAHGSVFLNTTVMNGSTEYTSSNKFAYNFGKLFKSDDLSCSSNVCTFTTPDGMSWKITDNFANASKNAEILVDINGDIEPNSSTTSIHPDQYTFEVDASGAVKVRGTDYAAEKAKRVLKDRKAKK